MPRDLFLLSPDPALRIDRRAGVLPMSVAAHIIVIGATVLVPAIAIGALPDPRVTLAYVTHDVLLPAVPVAPAPGVSRGRTMRPGAPTEAPSHLPEPGTEPPLESATPYEGPAVTGGLPFGWDGGVPGGLDAVGELPPPPPAPAAPRLVRVGGDVRPPVKVHDVTPIYPELARIARVQGAVVIDAIIDEQGRVSKATVRQSVPLLDAAALRAVRQWVFTPTRLNGEPTSVIMTVTVQFRLN